MGEVQSTQKLTQSQDQIPLGGHQVKHDLLARICEDIASGNEGDIIDMQCKQSMDVGAPHLWRSVSSHSTASGSMESLSSSPPLIPGHLHKSRTTAHEDLSHLLEDPLMDEQEFSLELMKAKSSPIEMQRRMSDEQIRILDEQEKEIVRFVE